jgi:hypothetical protein
MEIRKYFQSSQTTLSEASWTTSSKMPSNDPKRAAAYNSSTHRTASGTPKCHKKVTIILTAASHVHLILLSKEHASISLASSIISQAQELDEKKTSVEMFRMKISDTIKMSNANKKIDQVANSVIELEGIIKGNVNKLVTNMGDLESVEKKSEMMTSLSLQFEKDAKKL